MRYAGNDIELFVSATLLRDLRATDANCGSRLDSTQLVEAMRDRGELPLKRNEAFAVISDAALRLGGNQDLLSMASRAVCLVGPPLAATIMSKAGPRWAWTVPKSFVLSNALFAFLFSHEHYTAPKDRFYAATRHLGVPFARGARSEALVEREFNKLERRRLYAKASVADSFKERSVLRLRAFMLTSGGEYVGDFGWSLGHRIRVLTDFIGDGAQRDAIARDIADREEEARKARRLTKAQQDARQKQQQQQEAKN